MSFLKSKPAAEPEAPGAAELHALAQQKVRHAVAALGASREEDPPEEADVLVQQALERLRRHVGSLAAVDHAGQPMSEERLVHLIIDSLAGRSRDADTTAALLMATITPSPQEEDEEALLTALESRYRTPPAQPGPQATGWPPDAQARA